MTSVSLDELAPALYKAKVSLDLKEVERAEEAAIQKINVKKQLKGFRKGKAPKHLIRSQFSGEIKNEMMVTLVNSCLPEVQKKLERDLYKIISVQSLEKNDLEFTFSSTPYVNLCKLKEAVLYDDTIEVVDSEIDDVLLEIQAQLAVNNKKLKNDPVYKEGDLVVIDFDLLIDGIPSGKPQENVHFILGRDKDGQQITDHILKEQPNFNEEFQLPGESKGGEKNLIQLISVKSVYELEYPPLDENFPKLIKSECKNLDEFRNMIKDDLSKKHARFLQEYQFDRALQVYQERSEVSISEDFLEHHFALSLERMGVNPGQLDQDTLAKHKEAFTKELKKHLIQEEMKRLAHKEKSYSNKEWIHYAAGHYDQVTVNRLKKLISGGPGSEKNGRQNKINEPDKEFYETLITQYLKFLTLNHLRENGVFKKGAKKPIQEAMKR